MNVFSRLRPPPDVELAPEDYWLHDATRPVVFRIVRLFGWVSATILHAAVDVVGILAVVAIFRPIDDLNMMVIGAVALFLSGSYHSMTGAMTGFYTPLHFVYECYRLPVKHGGAFATAFFVAVAVAKTERSDWEVVGAWVITFMITSAVLSTLFEVLVRRRFMQPIRRASPQDPLAARPDVLRRPPNSHSS